LAALTATAFEAMDRHAAGWLPRSAWLDCANREELRALLAEAFGAKILEQPLSDLREDMSWIWEKLDQQLMGEISLPEFLAGIPRTAGDIRPMLPDSPRVPLEIRLNWARLARALRRSSAEVALHKPLAALKRLTRQIEGAKRQGGEVGAKMLLAQVGQEMSEHLEGFDWAILSDADLVQVLAQIAGLTALLAGSGGAPSLQTAKASIGEVVRERLDSWGPDDFITGVCALLPPPPAMKMRLGPEEALRQRQLLRGTAARAGELTLAQLAAVMRCVASLRDCQGECDPVVAEATAARIVYVLGNNHGRVPADIADGDIVLVLWVLAQYHTCPGSAVGAFELSTASQACARALAARGVRALGGLKDVEFARMCWALGRLGDIGGPLVAAAGAEATRRAAKLRAPDLAHVVWALASLGSRPAEASRLADAAEAADLEAVSSAELVRLAGGLGIWVLGSAERLKKLWSALGWHYNDFTSEELIIAARATLRLGVREDRFVRQLLERSLCIGPFDPEGSKELLRYFEQYSQRWPCEGNGRLAMDYALAAARRGNVCEVTARLAPPPRPDERLEGLREARRVAIRVMM